MEIINPGRFNSLAALFHSRDIRLSEREILIYCNVFEIISEFVNNKLTDEEILNVYDLLSDVIKNDRPDVVPYVSKEERISVQVRLMEELEETKGKLTMDEKVGLAFCIYTGECVKVYDEKRDIMCNGIVLFDSFEHIKNELDDDKKLFPDVYNFLLNQSIVFDNTYGFSEDNPIRATSISDSYEYLDRLRFNGTPILYDRIGSFGNTNGDIIDGYDIFVEKRGFFTVKQRKIATLYINPYCDVTPQIPPTGFTLQ